MKNATPTQMRVGLRIHAMVFLASMVLMVIINVLTGAPYWVGWVLLGWGIGMLSHWLAVRSRLAGKVRIGASE